MLQGISPQMKLPKNILVAVAANMLMAYPAIAEQVPQWELGAGLAYIDLPQYRGSNQRQVYFLPIPYAVYNGDFLKLDPERTGRECERFGAGPRQPGPAGYAQP